MINYIENITAEELNIWITSIVSIITLAINMAFYIFGQPRLGYRYKRKEQLANVCDDLFEFLAEIVSYNDFSGVPTKIRSYSLKIHLCFKEGKADEKISNLLEDIYQMVRQRKAIYDEVGVNDWNNEFKDKCENLRKFLAKYCGGL